MKILSLLLAAALGLVAADTPRVSRAALGPIEKSCDRAITSAFELNDPYDLLGTTRGLYLEGYGVVFTVEMNLAIIPVTPFNPPPDKAAIERLYAKKKQRLVVLKGLVRQMLEGAAPSLDNVPLNERIVFGVNLWYRSFELRDGLPSQLVMQATRQALLDIKSGKLTGPAADAAIHSQEF